ncbi:hypothetical protein Bca101_051309 [Brassica carinata]
MLNCWNVPVLDSGKKPPEFAVGEPPPSPFPPDPPDPSSLLSPVNFPPLSSQPSTAPKRSQRKGPVSSPASAVNPTLSASTTMKESGSVSFNGSVDPLMSAKTGFPQRSETLPETLTETTAKESGPGTNSAIPKSAKKKNAKIYQPMKDARRERCFSLDNEGNPKTRSDEPISKQFSEEGYDHKQAREIPVNSSENSDKATQAVKTINN